MAEINVAEHIEQIEKNIMSGLKDFQRATVNRIEGLYRAGQMRVLVSDEVGLGKTLIARGTVAKLAKMQKEQGDNLVKVVYICSNASIAEQNLNKLRISSELRAESTGSSRLSMQHIKIFRQENDEELLSRYIQLIPLTPDTSFRMTTGAGTVDERALMFAILRRIPSLEKYRRAEVHSAVRRHLRRVPGRFHQGRYRAGDPRYLQKYRSYQDPGERLQSCGLP